MSTPTWLLGRSTMMRPEPSAPRRKSRSRSGCVSRLRLSEKACGVAAVASCATGSSVTSRERPSICVR
jgi:hypothetical protein